MNSETRTCQNCKQNFTIEPDDFGFYEKMKVPPPTRCPECRLIRRLVFRNERALYKRKCDLCGDMRIMMYPPRLAERSRGEAGAQDVPFPVYCHTCWWSDKWEAKSYGRDYDFSKPFFEQFRELMHAVPRPGVIKQGRGVESEYTNRVTDMRHCYLIFGTTYAEYCRYGSWMNDSKECVDGYSVQKSERCYECIDCTQCYQVAFSQESNSCTDSWFLFNCNNCQNCFGCVNVRNKKYCIFNEQYTKEEYAKKINELQPWSVKGWKNAAQQFEELKKKNIVPALVTHHSINKSGNWIDDSKNVHHSFGAYDVEDGRYLENIFQAKDVMDYMSWGKNSERIYEAANCGIQCANVRFGHECWNQIIDAEYVMNCHSSKNLFGCVGIRNGEYMIFNKAYTKDEFEKMRVEIIEQMNAKPYRDAAGREYRYGEFFPIELSPHTYNESISQDFFPITKEEARAKHYPWRDPIERAPQITLSADQISETSDAKDSIVNEVIGCVHEGACVHQCTKAFRILKEDLEMYKRASLPLPRLCPNCRHSERLAKRNPLKLWQRRCQCKETTVGAKYTNTATHFHGEASCPNEFETSYSPEQPEIVYCEACYQAEVA